MAVAAGIRGRTGRALRWFVAVGLLLGFGWFFATRLDPAALVRALGGAGDRLAAAIHARSGKAHRGGAGAGRRGRLPRPWSRRLAGPERPGASERSAAPSRRRPGAPRRSRRRPAGLRADSDPLAGRSRADRPAHGGGGHCAGLHKCGAGAFGCPPYQCRPGHAGTVRTVRSGRHRRLPRGGCKPRARARVGRPLPHDAVHPRDHLGCGGSGTGIARCPGHARRGGSAMTLPLPVVPDPMGTAEGPVRPAASSARLTVAEWLRFGPFLAQIVVTRRCNLSCSYCNEYDDHSAPVPFESLDRRLMKLHQLRTWVVCLTGGEPTLHPELVRIVSRMRELGFRRRQVITNGYLLTPKLIEALNGAGLTG